MWVVLNEWKGCLNGILRWPTAGWMATVCVSAKARFLAESDVRVAPVSHMPAWWSAACRRRSQAKADMSGVRVAPVSPAPRPINSWVALPGFGGDGHQYTGSLTQIRRDRGRWRRRRRGDGLSHRSVTTPYCHRGLLVSFSPSPTSGSPPCPHGHTPSIRG